MPTNQFPFITTMKIPGVGLTLLVGLLLQFSLRAQEESRAEPPSPISFVASRISQHYHSILNVIVNTPFEPKAALPLEEIPSFELALKRFANMVSGYDLIQIGGSRVLLPPMFPRWYDLRSRTRLLQAVISSVDRQSVRQTFPWKDIGAKLSPISGSGNVKPSSLRCCKRFGFYVAWFA
ncbi:MAG: hypothetical protein PHV34_20170 [Verrucomicrobiae bacterium]|nr:hypothetical protein [Verrucomicrobiae bacterium]